MRLTTLLTALFALFLLAAPVMAADAPAAAGSAAAAATDAKSGRGIGAGVGAGLAIIGAGLGIGLIGYAALSGIARQPEQAGKIQVNMIIMAALVEGAAIIALILICLELTK